MWIQLLFIIVGIANVASGQYALNTTWQWQLQSNLNLDIDVDLYDVDLFDTSTATIRSLQDKGIIVICYYSAGSYEEWRTDADNFPGACKGKPLDGWAGERWIDFTCNEILDVMSSRLDLASSKGCDGVEPDNVDGYTQNSGFSLSYNDQITYNRWTANEAHARNLTVALKNDVEQIPDLVDFYDFAVNEACYEYNECDTYEPFTSAGKAVLNTEYEISSQDEFDDICDQSTQFQISSIAKTWSLKAPLCSCLAPDSNYKCDDVFAAGSSGDDDDSSSNGGFQWLYLLALLALVPIVGAVVALWCCQRGACDKAVAGGGCD